MSDHADRLGLTPITEEDILRIANRPGGINDRLRGAEDVCSHPDWWFSREICCCGDAHSYCTECGQQDHSCANTGSTGPGD